MATARFVAVDGLESAPLDSGVVLFDPKSGKFVMLNASAAYLWSELSSPRSEEELATRLCEEFSGLGFSIACDDTHDAVEQLKELELVQPVEG